MGALNVYPETLEFMKRIAEKRWRRLQQFINPAKLPFRIADEVDEEDSKTDLLGGVLIQQSSSTRRKKRQR